MMWLVGWVNVLPEKRLRVIHSLNELHRGSYYAIFLLKGFKSFPICRLFGLYCPIFYIKNILSKWRKYFLCRFPGFLISVFFCLKFVLWIQNKWLLKYDRKVSFFFYKVLRPTLISVLDYLRKNRFHWILIADIGCFGMIFCCVGSRTDSSGLRMELQTRIAKSEVCKVCAVNAGVHTRRSSCSKKIAR